MSSAALPRVGWGGYEVKLPDEREATINVSGHVGGVRRSFIT